MKSKIKYLLLLIILFFVGRTFFHDSLVIRQVNETTKQLENFYTKNGYYPTNEEFKTINKISLFYPNPKYGYSVDSFNFNQTYSLAYHINNPIDGAPGHSILDWGYKGQNVTSCDTRNVCAESNELDKNQKGVLWFIKPIADFTAGVTMNTGQSVSWEDYQTENIIRNHKWQFQENQYAGPTKINFSYDTSLLTKIEPIGTVEGSWYKKGSYFKAVKAGGTVLKIIISRPFYDIGYENGSYGGKKLMETIYSQEVKIKIVDDPSLLKDNGGFPLEEQLPFY
jgi:hypothetical protein